MGIKNGTIMIGHIAGDPRLTHSEKTGTPRFYARVGVDHWRREDDGTFTKTDRTFHDLAVRYKAAEAAIELFKKGDDFIATGRFEKFTDPTSGAEREEFRADTLTPNPVSTRLVIDREPRNGPARQAPGADRSQAFERPEQSSQARETATLGR
ncbi:single-stranded DNA-binding protein [Brevibacterium ravenspurgense]|uniref:single-stranded DNA-binding protein n=1 Tax=Brevibacterium ravenspurgense TaxID=479117 RepID=UPI000785B830|nr:single-stranded DNA-binding protein [Brevibacterium ravenspurgense]